MFYNLDIRNKKLTTELICQPIKAHWVLAFSISILLSSYLKQVIIVLHTIHRKRKKTRCITGIIKFI